LGVDDRGVVAAIMRGDPQGLAAAYDVYADRLHAFCASMLRDPDAAADALHDTFIVASQRVGQLRDPDRLRPWLYAIARNECLRQLRNRRRVTVLDEAGDMRDESVNLDRGLREAELRSLVWSAAEGLNPGERAALELSLRHGLEGRDLADALGVSVSHMNTLLTRARQQLERSLSAILVARTGKDECPELASIIAGWDGKLTVLMRKRISRHIENCDTCSERRRHEVSATALLSTLPLIPAPFGLRRRILTEIGDTELVAYRRNIAQRAGRFNRAGFPPAPGERFSQFRDTRWMAAGALLALLILGGSIAWLTRNAADEHTDVNAATAAPNESLPPFTTPPQPLTPSATPTPTPTPTSSTTPGVLGPAATAPVAATNPAPSPAAGSPGTSAPPAVPRPRVTPTPTRRPTTPPPAPGRLTGPQGIDLGLLDGTVTITATGGPVASWRGTVDTPAGVLRIKPASSDGPIPSGGSVDVSVAVNRRLAIQAEISSGVVTFEYPGGSLSVGVQWLNFPPVG
jgi:RNA polymerase sigma factor (sigma-70 family)